MIAFGEVAIWEVIGLDEIMRVESLFEGISVPIRKHTREFVCLSLWAHNEKVTAYIPGRERSPKTDHAATLTMDFQSPELWEN